jgi:hypothetical protein
VIICALAFVTAACTTAAATSSSSEPLPSSGESLAVGGIPIESLEGQILFTRAGGEFGDETVYTMDADANDERRITPFGDTAVLAGLRMASTY